MVYNAHPSTDRAMRISVSEAKGQLTELVRRAEAGDEVILTRTAIRRCGWCRWCP